MRGLIGDIRYAVRSLLKAPGSTSIALAALMLGIGANTACFSTIYELVRRPFAFPDVERVVRLWDFDARSGAQSLSFSAGDFLDYRAANRAFSGLGALRAAHSSLTGEGEPERLQGFAVSRDFFPVLGMQPILGRWFTPDEDAPGQHHIALISHGLWTRRFASDPKIAGATIQLDGETVTVVGVMPAKFDFPLGTDIWRPLALTDAEKQDRKARTLTVVGRLRPGVSMAQASEDLKAISTTLVARYPDSNRGHGVNVTGIIESANDVTDRFAFLLQAAAGFVLLLACVNVANLQLARGMARERETAVRSALGAGSLQLLRLHIIENLVLALAGAALGVGLAVWLLDLQHSLIPAEVYKWVPGLNNLRLHGEGVLFAAGAAVLSALACGFAPAVQAMRTGRMGEALKESARGNTGPRRGMLRQSLVVAEVALALVLLVSATLMIGAFRNLAVADLGYKTDRLLSFSTDLATLRYQRPEAIQRFEEDTVARLSATGGVVSVAVSAWSTARSFRVEGQPERPGDLPPSLELVSPGYFETMGIALLKGRTFTRQDASLQNTRYAVISESVARKYWGARDNPIGARITVGGPDLPPLVVAGVVGDLKDWFFREPQPQVYVLTAQAPSRAMRVWVRTAGDAQRSLPGVRAAMRQVDPHQPLFSLKTEEQLLSEQRSGVRLAAVMMMFYGGIALVLAVSGIYGVVSWSVARRTQELGIRMALGAEVGDVLRMVLGESMRMAGWGLAFGLVAAYGLTRLMAHALYGVVPLNPLIFLAVAVVLAGAALLAGYLPARRATAVDPLVALHYE